MTEILCELKSLADTDYREFMAKLLPTLEKQRIIGVRTPALRALAKRLYCTPAAEVFMSSLPHRYFEENQLHSFLLACNRDYEDCVRRLQAFLPYVDNWATCDQLTLAILAVKPVETLCLIRGWLASEQPYIVRFGMETLMKYYLDARFQPEYLRWVAEKRSDEYYVKMMVAWFFATALAKQYEATKPYLEQRRFSDWVQRKTIQKAVESLRLTPEQKDYLLTLK